MTSVRNRCCALVGLVPLLLPPVAFAGLKVFTFDTAEYGTANLNCVNSPSPPLFNRPEYGGQTAAYIADPVGCGNGASSGNNGSDSLLTAFFGASAPNSNEVRFSWVDPANDDNWLRLITFVAGSPAVTPVFRSPTVDIRPGSRISMKVLVYGLDSAESPVPIDGTHGLEFGLVIRETGRNLPLGADGGTTGNVEFVGFTSKGGGTDANAPNGGAFVEQTGCPDVGCSAFFRTIEWEFVDDAGVVKANVSVDGTPLAGNPRPIVSFAGDGILSATSFRGTLDSLAIRKPAADDLTKKWFVNIDDIEIEAPGITDPVQVLGAPILESATSVTVGSINTDDTTPPAPDGAEAVHLYRNGVDVPGSPATPPFTSATTHDFSGLTLVAGDVLTATQVLGGVESSLSDPVTVQSAATWAENFDSYGNQAAFQAAWPLGNSGTVGVMTLSTSTVHTCPNSVLEPAVATGAGTPQRIQRSFGLGGTGINGSDATPAWFTFYFYHGNSTGQRNWLELRRYSNGVYTSANTGQKMIAFGCYNSIAPTTNYQIRDVGGTGAVNWVSTGTARKNNQWVKMQIQVTTSNFTFFVDGVQAHQIPRVGDAGGFTHVVLGSGLSNNNTAAYFDSMSFSLGATPTDPFGASVVPQVTVQGPLAAGQTSVTVTGASTAAGRTVLVYDTTIDPDQLIGSSTDAGATVNVTVTSLVSGHDIKAIQQLADSSQSCFGPGIIVDDCSPVAAVAVNTGPLTPQSTTVTVSGTATGRLVKVYQIVAGVPNFLGSATAAAATVDVGIPGGILTKGDVVSATQTINTIEGCIPLSGANTAIVGSGTNQQILVTLGLRESTSNTGTIGANGATTLTGLGLIEWVFASGSVAPGPGSASPKGYPLTVGQNWQTVTFDPAVPSNVFGSGLTATADSNHVWAAQYGLIEHLAITQSGADTGPYVLYIDNIYNGATLVEDFEAPAGPPANTQVMFRQPTFSSSTSAHILTAPNSSYLSADYGDASAQSDKIQWQFKDEGTNRWIRLTTSTTANRPSPVVDLTQPITIRLLLLPAIVCNNPKVDFDNDDDVDMYDFAFFQKCFDPTQLLAGCECADVNGDNKVDASDFGDPQNPIVPTFVGCASRDRVKSSCAP